MDRLDADIAAAFQVVSLLLVFVLAYFTAIYSDINATLREPIGVAVADAQKKEVRADCEKYQMYLRVFSAVLLILFGLLMPLTVRVIGSWAAGGPYSTARAGLILVEVFLVFGFAAAVNLLRRLASRISEINASLAPTPAVPAIS